MATTIWVVDDEQAVREALESMIKELGYQVRTFAAAEEVLNAYKETEVSPDVVITDAALDETVYEPDAPVLRKGKTMSDEEKEDKALRDRTRNDTYLRRAADVLLGLKALGYGRKP